MDIIHDFILFGCLDHWKNDLENNISVISYIGLVSSGIYHLTHRNIQEILLDIKNTYNILDYRSLLNKSITKYIERLKKSNLVYCEKWHSSCDTHFGYIVRKQDIDDIYRDSIEHFNYISIFRLKIHHEIMYMRLSCQSSDSIVSDSCPITTTICFRDDNTIYSQKNIVLF